MRCRQLQEDQRRLKGLLRIVVDRLEEESGWSGGVHDKSVEAGGLLSETHYQALPVVRDADEEGIGGTCRLRVLKERNLEAEFSSDGDLAEPIRQVERQCDAIQADKQDVCLFLKEGLRWATDALPERLG